MTFVLNEGSGSEHGDEERLRDPGNSGSWLESLVSEFL